MDSGQAMADQGRPAEAQPPGAGRDATSRVLVAAMARGDAAAMAAFYDLYAGEVFALIRSMVADGQAAQDLLQETMWQAWRLAPRYDATRASVRTWLHLIMRSRVLDWRRHETRHPPPDVLETAGDVADPAASGEAARTVDRTDLRLAEAVLSPAERQAIRLTYYGGLTQSEAAQALGVPLGTVKSRVRSALWRMRTRLEAQAPLEEGPS